MDEKDVLKRYYDRTRASFLWKLDGLSERQVRMPLTPTGTNLLGLLKHVAAVDVEYLGTIFGRPFRHPLADAIEADPTTDIWAAADESTQMIKEFARDAWAHTDRTIDELDLDAEARVPWWGPDGMDVTLRWILVHVIAENAQHLGHADIVRELTDGSVGPGPQQDDDPDDSVRDRAAYAEKLRAIAESFPA